MKKKIVLLVFVLFGYITFGQKSDRKIDSLKKVLEVNNDKVKTINLISVLYQRRNIDSALFYAKKSVKIATLKKHKLLPNSLTGLGIAYWYKGKLDSAQYFIEKTLDPTKPILDSLLWAKNNCNVAILLSNKGNYNEAIKKYTDGNIYFLRKKDSVQVYKTHSNIAILYNTIKEYKLAYEENIKALNILKRLKNKEYLPRLYNNIGLNLIDLNNKEESLIQFNNGLKIAKKQSNLLDQSIILGNLGYVKIKLKRFSEARENIVESLRLGETINSPDTKIKNLISLAELEIDLKNIKSAKKIISKVDKEIKELKESNGSVTQTTEAQLLLLKSRILYSEKNFKKAFEVKERWMTIADSIKSVEFTNRVSKYKTTQEAQQKENQILKLENEAQQKELVLQKSKAYTNYSLAGIFLIILGGGLYLRKRKKDQKLKVLEASLKSGEEEKVRIGRELHDNIASDLRKLAHNTKSKDVTLSHKLLNSYNSIRDLSHQLNDTPMHGELFMDSVFELMPKNTENQKFNLKIDPPYLELNEPYSTHLYRIIQELFTNNLKYANASKTTVNVSLEDSLLVLNYVDNGLGTSNLKKGTGIKNIENRVILLKGKIKIVSIDKFTVNIEIPYSK